MRRYLPCLAYSLFTLGVLTATVGHFSGDRDTLSAGLLVSLATAPLCVTGALWKARQVSDKRLAESHREGYCLALRHVARGLLHNPRDTPPHGNRIVEAGNVLDLPIRADSDPPERDAK